MFDSLFILLRPISFTRSSSALPHITRFLFANLLDAPISFFRPNITNAHLHLRGRRVSAHTRRLFENSSPQQRLNGGAVKFIRLDGGMTKKKKRRDSFSQTALHQTRPTSLFLKQRHFPESPRPPAERLLSAPPPLWDISGFFFFFTLYSCCARRVEETLGRLQFTLKGAATHRQAAWSCLRRWGSQHEDMQSTHRENKKQKLELGNLRDANCCRRAFILCK